MTHPCTRIVFQVGDEDAKRLGDCFESFDARSLKTLEKYHAIARVERNDYDFNLAFRKPELPEKGDADGRKGEVIAASRSKYAVPRAHVEAALLASIRVEVKKPEPPLQPAKLTSPSIPKDSEQKAAEVPKSTVSEKENAERTLTQSQDEAGMPHVTAEADTPRHAKKSGETPTDLGRGGADHQALQRQLKEIALSAGYRAVTEKPILDGAGSVDVALEKEGLTIAVEVTVTTSIDQEFGNLRKRLKAGFTQIILVSPSELRVDKLTLAVKGEFGEESKRIHCCHPDDFAALLTSLQPTPTGQPPSQDKNEQVSRGYNTKIGFAKLLPEERKVREEAAHRLLLNAMRREKK